MSLERTLGAFLRDPPPHPRWLAAPIIPCRGLAVLGGPAKVAKTIVALNWAYSLASGREFFGARSQPLRVLYVDLEVGPWAIRDRLHSIHGQLQMLDAEENFAVHCRSRERISLEEGTMGLENLRAMVAHHRPSVLVLDPLRDCFSGDENDSGVMTKVFLTLFRLLDEYSCAAILVHHCGKPGLEGSSLPETSPYALRGSSRLVDVGDSYIMLRSTGADTFGVRAYFTLRHGMRHPVEGHWAKDDYLVRFKESPNAT